jgi:PHP family Zn ribbon phosphoesterase
MSQSKKNNYDTDFCYLCETRLVEFGTFCEAWTCPECAGWLKDGVITRKGRNVNNSRLKAESFLMPRISYPKSLATIGLSGNLL